MPRREVRPLIPFEGTYEAPDDGPGGTTLTIRRNADATYSVELSIYRLTTQDDGVGKRSNGVLTFTATDAAGNPMTWEAAKENGVLEVRVVKSTWSLLPEGEQFTFHPVAAGVS